MKFNLLVLLFLGLCLCAQQAFAGNPDILWQKTLTANTLPIRSIAIAEGKYVAALKGNQIIILDYATGDSIKSFTTPKEMYGNDIILGKGGERLYVFVGGQGNYIISTIYLRSWNIATNELYKDIQMTKLPDDQGFGYSLLGINSGSSIDGKWISVGATYEGNYGSMVVSDCNVFCFNTSDSTYLRINPLNFQSRLTPIFKNSSEYTGTRFGIGGGGLYNFSVSHSGNYVILNRKRYTENRSGIIIINENSYGDLFSLSSSAKSYQYSDFISTYTFSHDDDFLLLGNQLYDLPPTRVLRTITKPGLAFLPDDNHLLAFKAGGGVAAISNIEKDTWEKVFYGDSLTENLIQPCAGFSSFVTATDKRITLWKIPDTLEHATLTAAFTQSKDTIQIYDSVVFTNMTYPFKRGTNYEWNFGESSPIVTTAFPVHTFARAGTFTVTLSVRDTLGATSSVSRTIVVDFPAPKANFTTSLDTVAVGNVVELTNQSTPILPGTHFSWNFGDGSTFSQEMNPVHQYFNIGKYDIILTIRDTIGRTNSFAKQLVVANQILPNGALWTNHFHSQRINSLAFSPDAVLIISGSNDGYSRIWEGSTGLQLFSRNVRQLVYSTAFTNNNKSALVSSYQITDNSPVYVKGSVAKFINYVDRWDFSQDSWERKFTWNIDCIFSKATYQYITNAALSSSFSSNNTWFCTGVNFTSLNTIEFTDPSTRTTQYGNISITNLTTNKSKFFDPKQPSNLSIKELNYLLLPIYYTQISPDNQYYFVSQGSRFYIRDLRTDSVYREIPHQATLLRFSPNKYHLLTNTGLWDIYDSILVQPVTLPQVFEFHPDGIHVFTIRPDSTIGIFNLNSNSYEYLYPKQPRAFTCLAVAPDGKHIATGDNSGYITVWNVPDTLKSSIKIDFHALSFKRNAVKTSDTVEFANTSLPANNSFDYLWNFGDGTTSTERAPQHRYLKPGKYTVSLTASQNGQEIDSITKTQYITVTGPIGVDESQVGLYSIALSITPNPSYAETQIHLTLAQASNYNVRIMDNLGREIARWEEHSSAGEHVILWNENVPSGVYYCTLSVGGEVRMVPFVVVR
ncbi:MAG: PKD domain-containing protein [Ignavibacteria bacterium]|nr:PKD domain-containing protein [Ignavibacteria bacterium]